MNPLFLTLAAWAATGPLPVHGTLTDADGATLEGSRSVTFSLFTDASDTTADHDVTRTVEFVGGGFSADIGAFDLDWFATHPQAQLTVTLRGAPTRSSKATSPRGIRTATTSTRT
jgi:hypothetical protein